MNTDRFFDSRLFPLVFLLISFVFLLLYSSSLSPVLADEGYDSAIFKIIGTGINQGKLPYVDLFDHKGPFIFYINALGLSLIPGKWGIFLLEVLFFSVTLYFIYRTTCLFAGKKTSFAAVLVSLVPLMFMFDGNHCEEWVLPLISISLYLSMSWLTGKSGERHSPWNSLVYGICFSLMFFMRPNDAVIGIGSVMFGVFLVMIVRKMYKDAFYNVLTFIAGCGLTTAVICVFFASKGILAEMLDGTVFFNVRYASAVPLDEFGWKMIVVPAFVLGGAVYSSLKSKTFTDICYILVPYLLLTWMFIGKRNYGHYLIPLLPLIPIFIVMTLKSHMKVLAVTALIFLPFGSRAFIKHCTYRNDAVELYKSTDALFLQVPEDERNSVWNYNLTRVGEPHHHYNYSLFGVYTHAGMTPGNRVFVPWHLGFFDSSESILNHSPKWVLRQFDGIENEETAFIDANYDLVAESNVKCRIGLYRLRDGKTETDYR